MKRPQFKVVEREVAAILGGVRVPVSGRTRDETDVDHAILHISVKARTDLRIQKSWWWRCRAAARKAEKLPLLVLRGVGIPGVRGRRAYYLAVMDLRDLAGLLAEVRECQPPESAEEAKP